MRRALGVIPGLPSLLDFKRRGFAGDMRAMVSVNNEAEFESLGVPWSGSAQRHNTIGPGGFGDSKGTSKTNTPTTPAVVGRCEVRASEKDIQAYEAREQDRAAVIEFKNAKPGVGEQGFLEVVASASASGKVGAEPKPRLGRKLLPSEDPRKIPEEKRICSRADCDHFCEGQWTKEYHHKRCYVAKWEINTKTCTLTTFPPNYSNGKKSQEFKADDTMRYMIRHDRYSGKFGLKEFNFSAGPLREFNFSAGPLSWYLFAIISVVFLLLVLLQLVMA